MKSVTAESKIGIKITLSKRQKVWEMDLESGFVPSATLFINNKDVHIGESSILRGRFISTSGLCLIETKGTNIEKEVMTLDITGSHILLSFLPIVPSANTTSSQTMLPGNINIHYCEQDTYDFPLAKMDHTTHVIMSREYYMQIFQNETFSNYFDLFNSVQRNMPFRSEENGVPLSLAAKNVLHKMLNNPFRDAIKKFYIEAKLRGLISLLQEERMRKVNHVTHYIREDILEKLYHAKSILDNNYQAPPTIRQLSKMVVLNEKDLKAQFKFLFDTTIHSYLVKLRMEAAYTMINDKNVMIFEVALRLGYKDTSHFINMFKKYFGYTPKYFCKHMKLVRILFSVFGIREVATLLLGEMLFF